MGETYYCRDARADAPVEKINETHRFIWKLEYSARGVTLIKCMPKINTFAVEAQYFIVCNMMTNILEHF